MTAPVAVRRGETLPFVFGLEGEDLSGFSYILTAKQYPADIPRINRAVTANADGEVAVTLSTAETADLYDNSRATEHWILTVISTDADETIESSKRIELKPGWA